MEPPPPTALTSPPGAYDGAIAVTTVETVGELTVIGELIRAARVNAFERRAVDRALQGRVAQ